LSNPSAVDTSYFVLTGTGVWITHYDVFSLLETVSVPTTADTIDEVDETLALLNGTVSATGTIIDNNNAHCGNDHPASATEGSDVVFDFTLSNPSAGFCILLY
jgi:hypothetical protein